MFSVSWMVWLLVNTVPGWRGNWSVICCCAKPPNCCVVMVPTVLVAPVERMLTPSWVSAERSTSANFTSSSTSCAPTGPKVSTLTTFLL
jgi:hypothetical protein